MSLDPCSGKPWRVTSARMNAGMPSSRPWGRRWAGAPAGCFCRGRRETASWSINGRQITAMHWPAARRSSLALDMYEHSYQMDFGAKAASYVDAFMGVVSWGNADRLFSEVADSSADR